MAEAGRLAADAGAMLVLDGAPEDSRTLAEVLPTAAVLRADGDEAAALVGRPLDGLDGTVAAARGRVAAGVPVVALGAGADGNVVAWRVGRPMTARCARSAIPVRRRRLLALVRAAFAVAVHVGCRFTVMNA